MGDNIRMDLEDIGNNTRNWVDSTQDRDYLRALVNAALNLRVPWVMELASYLLFLSISVNYVLTNKYMLLLCLYVWNFKSNELNDLITFYWSSFFFLRFKPVMRIVKSCGLIQKSKTKASGGSKRKKFIVVANVVLNNKTTIIEAI